MMTTLYYAIVMVAPVEDVQYYMMTVIFDSLGATTNQREACMKFTEDINGCDLERLADCIKFASKHGFKTGKYTQCGVNSSSGNVWLWDEDWMVCIYCNIGFETAMMWSCPICGNEEDVELGQVIRCCEEFNNDYPDGLTITN
jgi:predicted RNA-binding Zn-ribbon protein involved in translation (DUF1610 family)